jgi:hypothetical protein
MRNLVGSVLALLLLAGSAQATTVTGQVKDVNGISYANARLTLTLVNANGFTLTAPATITQASSAICQAAGLGPAPCQQPFPMNLGPFTLDAGGNVPGGGITATDNTLATPAGTLWVITALTLGSPPPLGTGPQACTATITISGGSQSISANFSACPALSVGGGSASSLAGPGSISGTFGGNPTLTGNVTAIAGQNSLNFFQHNGILWTGTSSANYPFTNPQTQIANCLTLTQFGCRIDLVSGNYFTNSSQTDIGTNPATGRVIVLEGQPDVRWLFTGTAGGSSAAWSLHNGSAMYGSQVGVNGGSAGARRGSFNLVYDCTAKSAYGLSTAEGLTTTQAFGNVKNIFIDGCLTGTVAGGGSPSIAMFNWEGISSMNEVSNVQIANFANTVGFRVGANAASGTTGPFALTNVWAQGQGTTGALPCEVQGAASATILPLVFTSGVCNNPGSGMDAFYIDSSAGTNNLWGLHSTGQYFEDVVNGNNKMIHVHHATNVLFETSSITGQVGDTGLYLDQSSAGGTAMVQAVNLRLNNSAVTAINNTITGFTLSGFLLYPLYHYGGKSNTNTVAPMFIDDNDLALTSSSRLHVYNGTFTGLTNYERGFAQFNGNVFEIGTEELGTGVARDIRIKPLGGAAIRFSTTNTDRWFVQAGGTFGGAVDNTYDIGNVASNRPRNIYAATEVSGAVVQANLGTACASGNIVITGWGTGAATSAFSGFSSNCVLTITAGTTPSANPTIAFTFPNAFSTAPTGAFAIQQGGTGIIADLTRSVGPSTTAVTYQWNATPTSAATYIILLGATP